MIIFITKVLHVKQVQTRSNLQQSFSPFHPHFKGSNHQNLYILLQLQKFVIITEWYNFLYYFKRVFFFIWNSIKFQMHRHLFGGMLSSTRSFTNKNVQWLATLLERVNNLIFYCDFKKYLFFIFTSLCFKSLNSGKVSKCRIASILGIQKPHFQMVRFSNCPKTRWPPNH